MVPEEKQRFLWGWLRLFLGFAQISLVAMSIGALIAVGVKAITWIFVVSASALTLLSLIIYRARSSPD